jgi:hypothetical protein
MAGIFPLVSGCDGTGWRAPSNNGGNLFNRPARPAGSGQGQWTIECRVETGANHRQNAELLADMLRQTPDLSASQVRVEHDLSISKIFYGSYRARLDADTGRDHFPPELQQTVRYLRQLRTNRSQQPFLEARTVPIMTPDEGPPEWDLGRADFVYSLQIGVFYNRGDFTERKKAAVEYTRHWREKGYEAYYFHGNVRSHTLVGAFDSSALIQTSTGQPKYAKSVIDLQKKEPEFAWNIENGRKIKRVREGKSTIQTSFLISVDSARKSQ